DNVAKLMERTREQGRDTLQLFRRRPDIFFIGDAAEFDGVNERISEEADRVTNGEGFALEKHREMLTVAAGARLLEDDFEVNQAWVETLNELIVIGTPYLGAPKRRKGASTNWGQVLGAHEDFIDELGWYTNEPGMVISDARTIFTSPESPRDRTKLLSPRNIVRNLELLYQHLGDDLMTPIRVNGLLVKQDPDKLATLFNMVITEEMDPKEYILAHPERFTHTPLRFQRDLRAASAPTDGHYRRREILASRLRDDTVKEKQLADGILLSRLEADYTKSCAFTLERDGGWLELATVLRPDLVIDQLFMDRLNNLRYQSSLGGPEQRDAAARALYAELGWTAEYYSAPGSEGSQAYVPRIETFRLNMRSLYAHVGNMLMMAVQKGGVRLLTRNSSQLVAELQGVEQRGFESAEVFERNPEFFSRGTLKKLAEGDNPLYPPLPKPKTTKTKSAPKPVTSASKPLVPYDPDTESKTTIVKKLADAYSGKSNVPSEARKLFDTADKERQDLLRTFAAEYLENFLEPLVELCSDVVTCSDEKLDEVLADARAAYWEQEDLSVRSLVRIIRSHFPEPKFN
ncbi:MAG: hypothetical protein ABWX94_02670, partial [Candidatus Saccharimonadales bacterium]